MRDWLIAGAVVERPDGLLLVCNRRRSGVCDWSPPGGVIDPGESVIDGLTREVEEETGLRVVRWEGPLYEVRAEAPGLGWRLRGEIHRAVDVQGEVRVDDPDGIVVDARWVPLDESAELLGLAHPWVREPLAEWLYDPWDLSLGARLFDYLVEGTDLATLDVTRR